ncbi:MAG: 2Fe-2S iron-sulfur cluster-binding protein [Bdellovibrionales bacterium]
MKTKCAAHHGEFTYNIKLSGKKSLLDDLRAHKVPVPFSCGGEGICTTCRVVLVNGALSPRTELEKDRAEERGYSEEERLSCQCHPVSEEIEIKIP